MDLLCDHCGKEANDHMLIQLAGLGECIEYVIPSFPVFEATLKHVKYSFCGADDQDNTVYDRFVQAKMAGDLAIDSILKLCSGYSNAFVIESEEFDRAVDVAEFKLVEAKVFVIWKWNLWSGEDIEAELTTVDTECADNDCCEEEEEELEASTVLHSIIFKCIGTTKEEKYQHVLAKAAHARKNNIDVKAQIVPEPHNPVDAKAVAFRIFMENKWERVGYMVTEVLDAVHKELLNENITAVELEWVKFITHSWLVLWSQNHKERTMGQ